MENLTLKEDNKKFKNDFLLPNVEITNPLLCSFCK